MTPIPPISVHTDDKGFVSCLPLELVLEGGNDDDPHDPGGRTSRGIIQREYNVYRHSKGLPVRDVWKADWDEIFDIYYSSYWLPWGPQLWPGVNQMWFDQAINQGPVQATRNLQRALNSYKGIGTPLAVDGHLGPATLYALNSVVDRAGFLKAYYDWDMSFYRSLRNWAYFGAGWTNRARTVYAKALTLVPQPPDSVVTS